MKVSVYNPYEVELEKPTKTRSDEYRHEHLLTSNVIIQIDGQMFNITWDEQRNALRIIGDKLLTIKPSSANGILIQDIEK